MVIAAIPLGKYPSVSVIHHLEHSLVCDPSKARQSVKSDRVSLRRHAAHTSLETLTAHYVKQSFKPHSHEEYVIGVIEAGTHSVWCKGDMYKVAASTVVTMNPGDVHYGGAGDETGWKQRMIYVSRDDVARFVSDIIDTDKMRVPEFCRTFHDNPALASNFIRLHDVLHSSPLALSRDVALDALLRQVVGTLSPSSIEAKPRPDSGRIGDAVDYLHARVEKDVTLDELCDVSGLRRRQTIEAFKRKTGLPPHAYHLLQKVNAVKGMLRNGVSATQAAAEAGFADQSHMTRHFVGIVGITPAAYGQSALMV